MKSHFTIPPLNKVITIIIFSDFILTTAASLLTPIFALFVMGEIRGGSARAVGFSIAIYWIVKSALQLPIARYLDRNHGEIDDHRFMIMGLIMGSVVIGAFFFASELWHLYALQALLGIADAMLLPPFYAIFTRHIDRGSEGFDWSLRSSLSFGGGAAIGGALGGILLAMIGFRKVFLLSSLLYLGSAGILLFLQPYLIPKTSRPVKRLLPVDKTR